MSRQNCKFVLLMVIFMYSHVTGDVFTMEQDSWGEGRVLTTLDPGGMQVTIMEDGSYFLSVENKLWLNSAPSFVKIDGKVHSTQDGSLALQKFNKDSGADLLGHWQGMNAWYLAGSKRVILSYKVYKGVPAVIFGQRFLDGGAQTSTGKKDDVLSGFPGFAIDSSQVDLGYLSYGYLFVGNMGRKLGRLKSIYEESVEKINASVSDKRILQYFQRFLDGANGTSTHIKDNILSGFPGFVIDRHPADLGYLAYGYLHIGNKGRKLGRWDPTTFLIKDGRDGGPMALFDAQGHALFISPFDQFMAASVWHDQSNKRYYWGIMGGVESIPQSFSYHTIVYYSPDGINAAIAGWGAAMRQLYNKPDSYRESDFTINYLSYWSDNGAYYVNYYVKGGLIQNLTYEQAMLGVTQYAQDVNIPYRSVQYSVWFKQGKFGGNSEWTANPSLFKSGMKYMFEKTQYPSTAHSRYWSPDTPYAKQNGGKYNFFVEPLRALPYDQEFWTDMFRWSQQWGFKTYMQDWLNDQFDNMNATTNNVYVARDWLMQMGRGAELNGITIQYCMSLCRHVLQSLEIPVVTQARASDDYQPNDALQWRIGMSSIFAWAVGIAPFKDTFWTTTEQPGNYYKNSEPFPAMHTVISTLSRGPVGPGDMINGTDVKLLMKCCAADGLILNPSKPAMAINAQIMQEALGGNIGPSGEVWTTYSDIAHLRFGIIFATNMTNSFNVTPSNSLFGREYQSQDNYIYSVSKSSVVPPREYTNAQPVLITPKCTNANFCLYYTTPKLTYGDQSILLLGEITKWVPISPKRIAALKMNDYDLELTLKGAPGEKVDFHYFSGSVEVISCTMSPAGRAVIRFSRKQCVSV